MSDEQNVKNDNISQSPQNDVESSVEQQNNSPQNTEAAENINDADRLTKDLLDGKISEDSGSEDNNKQEEQEQEEVVENEQLEGIKDKISQILRTQGIEIVDENEGDEYDESQSKQKSQKDYDELKSIFGDEGLTKSKQLTLTIDDFDYTYVGQYVDEFDLLHVKNIKHIKMPKRFPKPLKRVLLVASIVLFLGLAGFLAYYFTREVPVYITSVTLSQNDGYYLSGQTFSYDELYLIVKYSTGTTEYVELKPEYYHSVSGNANIQNADSQNITFNQVGSFTLTFQYSEFYADYNVTVSEYRNAGLSAIVNPDIFIDSPTYLTNKNFVVMFVSEGVVGAEETVQRMTKLSLFDNASSLSIQVLNSYGNLVAHCNYVDEIGYKLNSILNSNSILKVSYNHDHETFEIFIKYLDGKVVILNELE